ncbi:hypothetical protein KW475_18365, partial [Vibrio fluvialis]|nr:hypothetical protein [Vibrio fluvialis]
NTILYLNTLFFVEIIKIDKNSKKSLNFHRGICVGKTGIVPGLFYGSKLTQMKICWRLNTDAYQRLHSLQR